MFLTFITFIFDFAILFPLQYFNLTLTYFQCFIFRIKVFSFGF